MDLATYGHQLRSQQRRDSVELAADAAISELQANKSSSRWWDELPQRDRNQLRAAFVRRIGEAGLSG